MLLLMRRSNSPAVATQRVIKKQTLRGQQTQRNVLQAAEEVFGRRGLQRSSVQQIAQRAGVATGTFYVHFESKEQLFLALVEDLGLRLETEVTEATRERTGSRQRAVLETFLAFVRQRPHLYRLVRQAEDLDLDVYRGFYRRIATAWATALRDGMQHGDVPRANPEVLAWILMGVLHFIGMRFVEWEDDADEALLDEVSAFIEAGLRRRSPLPSAAPRRDGEDGGYTFFG